MAPQLDSYFKQVDSLSGHFIDRLRKAVAIPSISADEERRPDVVRMGQFLADELSALGAEVQQRPLGKQPGKDHLELPPVVIARYGNDKKKRTILVYGHYDVQPPQSRSNLRSMTRAECLAEAVRMTRVPSWGG